MRNGMCVAFLSLAALNAATHGGASLAPGYGKLPLSFEPNVGQADREVLYVARGNGDALSLKRGGTIVAARADAAGRTSHLAMRMVGANTAARHETGEALTGRVNYFVGDRSHWRTDVPTYGRVTYRQIYHGIDMAFYGNQGSLEYDFIIAPGADPDTIRLAFDGIRNMRVNANGDLLLDASTDGSRQRKPYAYQLLADGTQHEVAARFAVERGGTVRFVVGEYDRAKPLLIDPVLTYASYLGGSGNEGLRGLKVDSTGAVYFTGFTTSTNFPATNGALQTSYKGQGSLPLANFGDAFVTKLTAAGDALVYTTYLGGTGDEIGTALALDASGNAYITGSTTSSDFPTTNGAYQRTYGGKGDFPVYSVGDAFVTKLNATGNQLVFSTYLGGTLDEGGMAIAVDSAGNVTVAGNTESTNFPTAGAIQNQYRGATSGSLIFGGDAFLSRLNAAGTSLLFSTYLGGRNDDMALALALDSAGNAYVAGITYSPDFPTTSGAFQTAFHGREDLDFTVATGDGFVTKVNPSGSAIVYSTFLGGRNREGIHALAVDSAGNVYVCGRTDSPDFPVTSGVVQSSYKGTGSSLSAGRFFIGDAFVAKLNPAGSSLIFSTYLGGGGDDAAVAIGLESSGNIVVAGFTTSRDFPVSSDALQSTWAGGGGQDFVNPGDAFVTRLNPFASSILFSTYYGGSADDAATSVAVDSNANAYIGGSTMSSNLKTAGKPAQATYGGSFPRFPRGDAFVAKINFTGVTVGPPATISFVTGTPQTATAGAEVSLTVEVLDAQKNPVPNTTVTFTATNATLNPATATTEATGRAVTRVTLGTAGSASVSAAVAGLAPVTFVFTVTASATVPTISAVVNGASFLRPLAPGSWMTLGGQNLAKAVATANAVPFPTTLGGVRVRVNNTFVPLLYVSSIQVNVQLPYEIPAGQATAVIEVDGTSSASFPFQVTATGPGIFVFGNNRAVVQNVDASGAVTLNTSDDPVKAGGIIIAYLTGQGPLDNPLATNALAPSSPLSRATSTYSATIGTRPAAVAFLGMTPGFVALAQANITVPDDLPTGDYPLVISVGGVDSNGPLISVVAK